MALQIQKDDCLQATFLVFEKLSVELASNELGLSEAQVMARLKQFTRYISHSSRFGSLKELSESKWNSINTIGCSKNIHCSGLFREAVRRFKIELSSGEMSIWSKPLPTIVDLPIPKSAPRKILNWDAEMDALLGKSSDQLIADRLRVKQSDVRKRRLKLRIDSFGGGGLDNRK